jgi:hypothetical protein
VKRKINLSISVKKNTKIDKWSSTVEREESETHIYRLVSKLLRSKNEEARIKKKKSPLRNCLS